MPASAQTGQQPPEVGAGDLPVHTKKFRNELANEITKIANKVIERLYHLVERLVGGRYHGEGVGGRWGQHHKLTKAEKHKIF